MKANNALYGQLEDTRNYSSETGWRDCYSAPCKGKVVVDFWLLAASSY